MRENFEANNDDFLDYVDKWEKVMNTDLFKTVKPATPSPQTSDDSFFGLRNTHPTLEPSDVDSQYWAAIHHATGVSGGYADPLSAAEELITDSKKARGKVVAEQTHREFPANPVAIDTGGVDQDLIPSSLGQTFSEEDLKSLEEMKLKLFDLESKVSAAMGKGEKISTFEAKVNSIKKRINDLSDSLSRPYKNDIV